MHNETASVPLGTTTATITSPAQRQPHSMDLLEINLEDFVEDPSKLLKYAIALQNCCREWSRVRQEDSDRSQTGTSSRKTTDDSDFKKKQLAMSSKRERSAILLDPSTNNLTVVRWALINDRIYVQGKLPSFHWWNDRLHVYSIKTSGQLRVEILKNRLDKSNLGDRVFLCTVRLGKLGFGIKARRLFGQLNSIYVLSIPAESQGA